MRKNLLILIIVIVVLGGFFLIQQNRSDEVVIPDQTDFITDLAIVKEIKIDLLESFPVQVQVTAFGDLADSCTRIGEIEEERKDNTFTYKLYSQRQADAVCATVITPFEEVIGLESIGLLAGEYMVGINGVAGSFTLEVDNIFPEEALEELIDQEETEGVLEAE